MRDGRKQVLKRTFHAIRDAIRSSVYPRRDQGNWSRPFRVIDRDAGVVLSYPRPGQMTEWKNIPLRGMLRMSLRSPVCWRTASAPRRPPKSASAGKRFGQLHLYRPSEWGSGRAFFRWQSSIAARVEVPASSGTSPSMRMGPLCSCGNNGVLKRWPLCRHYPSRSDVDGTRIDSRVRILPRKFRKVSIELIAQAVTENDSLASASCRNRCLYRHRARGPRQSLESQCDGLRRRALSRSSTTSDGSPEAHHQTAIAETSANEVQLMVSSLGSEAGALGARD